MYVNFDYWSSIKVIGWKKLDFGIFEIKGKETARYLSNYTFLYSVSNRRCPNSDCGNAWLCLPWHWVLVVRPPHYTVGWVCCMLLVCRPSHHDSVAVDGMTDRVVVVPLKWYELPLLHSLPMASNLSYNCAPFWLYLQIFPKIKRRKQNAQ